MNKEFAISVDIGTTNTKVTLYRIEDYSVEKNEKFNTSKFTDNYGELFDIEKIYEKIVEVLTKFIKSFSGNIDSVNITSVGEVGVLLTNDFVRATDAVAWYDIRSSKFIEDLTNEEKKRIYEITGLPAHTNYVVSKLKWLYEYGNVSTTEQYIWANISDYIAYLLSGSLRTEYSLASRTMCFDIQKKCWSNEILKIFNIQGFVAFPEVVLSGETIGYTDLSVTKSLRKEKIAVKIAGHDHMVGAYGIKLQENELLNSTGTTEGLLYINDKAFVNQKNYKKQLSSGVYIDPSFYTLFSSMPTGGAAFEWIQRLFNIDFHTFNKMNDELYNDYMKGNINLENCLTVIPHLNGSGSPFKNSASKGLVYGLTMNTNQKDFLLGILIGLSIEMSYVSKSFPLKEIDRVIVIGPATKNKLWLQLKADFLNKEVVSINTDEVVSLGGVKTAYKERAKENYNKNVIEPNSRNIKEIKDIIEKYKLLYKTKMEITLYKNEEVE